LVYFFEDYCLDPDRRELRRGTELVAVEPRVFDLLQFLIDNRERVVSKDDLIAAVWGGRIVSDSALTSRMNAARHAVADSGEQQRLIRTIARKGHRFVGEVKEERASGYAGDKAAQRPVGVHRASNGPEAITFCKTKDGTNLAIASVGEGPVLLRTSSIPSHLEFDWKDPIAGPPLQHLAMGRRLVRYDYRGTGLSDRNVTEISFTTFLEDLEAVADSLKLDRFALFGMSGGAATAIAYAVRHPARVSKLVISGGYALGRNRRGTPRNIDEAQAILTMLRSGWPDASSPFWKAFNSFFLPSGSPEQFKCLMDYHRAAASADDSIKLRLAVDDIDILSLLPKLTIPTMVFHCRRDHLVPFEQGRLLAASIPNAKFIPLDSENHILLSHEPAFSRWIADTETFLRDG
jgi:pimeloyl-ACP methyl ester carboxylesterase